MSDETECGKRARRITALRAKAAATNFEGERDAFTAKANELQALNDAAGYRDPKITDAIFEGLINARKEEANAEHVRRYQEHLRRQEETGKRWDADRKQQSPWMSAQDARNFWENLFGDDFMPPPRQRRARTNRTHAPRCACSTCFEQRANATGGTYSSYTEYDPETGKSRTHTPCTECRPDAMCNSCFQKMYGAPVSDQPKRSRINHSQCYAEGLHDKSPAGRASCRRNQSR